MWGITALPGLTVGTWISARSVADSFATVLYFTFVVKSVARISCQANIVSPEMSTGRYDDDPSIPDQHLLHLI